jgi:hypothetical protein
MVTEERTSCCVSHRATAITSGLFHRTSSDHADLHELAEARSVDQLQHRDHAGAVLVLFTLGLAVLGTNAGAVLQMPGLLVCLLVLLAAEPRDAAAGAILEKRALGRGPFRRVAHGAELELGVLGGLAPCDDEPGTKSRSATSASAAGARRTRSTLLCSSHRQTLSARQGNAAYWGKSWKRCM